MINERKLKEIENVSNALKELNAALVSEEFTKTYQFKKPANATDTIGHGALKGIAEKLYDKGIGFDPGLIIQHIEKEVLRQFNEVVEEAIRGRGIESLMNMKHALEKFDLVDRIEFFTDKLATLEKELALESGVQNEEDNKKTSNKKTNKKG